MNWRAIGCGASAAAVFVGIGLLGMWLAFRAPEGCPATLRWAERSYEADGVATETPSLGGSVDPVEIGSTFMGLITRRVFGEAGTPSAPTGDDRPEAISVECGDGTFQTYLWTGRARPS